MNNFVRATKCLNLLAEIEENIRNMTPDEQKMDSILLNIRNLSGVLEQKIKDNQTLTEITIPIISTLFAKKLYNVENTDEIDKILSYLKKYSQDTVDLSLSGVESSHQAKIARLRTIRGSERVKHAHAWRPDEAQVSLFKGIIAGKSSWEYPVMEIFPGTGDFTEAAIGSEPLYIVDWDKDILDLVSSKFNTYYASKRLMQYAINGFDMGSLPRNSFGFVFVLNYMLVETYELYCDMINSVYHLLMPGGHVLFKVNPIQKWWGAEAMETYNIGAINTDHLQDYMKSIGYTIVDVSLTNPFQSYIMAMRPGKIENVKRSSMLAKIIDRPANL